MDEMQARSLIAAAFPDLVLRRIRGLVAGWSNTAWVVNDRLVVRFPKNAASAETTRKEIAVMPELARVLPVAVPDYCRALPDGVPGYNWPIAAYTLIPGKPLNRIRKAPAPGFAAAVGRFLTALHAFPAERALSMGVPGGTAQTWHQEYADWYQEIRRQIWPVIPQRARDSLEARFEEFLESDRHFNFKPALIHRDLSKENMLGNPKTGELTGVIGFENMTVGDPAFDLTGLEFLEPEVLTHYQGPADADFAERILFYRTLVPVHEIVYGVNIGNEAHIRRGIRLLSALQTRT